VSVSKVVGQSRRFAPGLALLLGLVLPATPAGADIANSGASERVAQTICRIVESAAHANHLPIGFLTRLVWEESRFRAEVTSRAGAQGIAQFMPETAAERGLLDPFDPEQAIPEAARLLVDMEHRFGNLGLAAAAYNAGPNRVAAWLDGSASLPAQTQVYVLDITGHVAEDWHSGNAEGASAALAEGQSCLAVTAALQESESGDQAPLAPWGVQLAGNFSKAVALASFGRAQLRYHAILGDLRPMVVGGVLRSRGTRRFYRVLIPASSRGEADHICTAILAHGGACVALRT
jgi:hypothetical protein